MTSAYLAFVASTLQSLFPGRSYSHCLLSAAGFVLPTTWLRDFAMLSKLSQSGTFAVLLGYLVTIQSGSYAQANEPLATRLQGLHSMSLGPDSWQDLAQGFGPVAFLFCIHFLLFPVMTSARSSATPGKFVQLAAVAFLSAGMVNAMFAYTCLALFGSRVSSIVLNDVGQGTLYLVATKLLLCADLLCSYPLVFAAGREIVERSLFEPQTYPSSQKEALKDSHKLPGLTNMGRGGEAGLLVEPKRCGLRLLLVAATVIVAQLDFAAILSLVGGVAQVRLPEALYGGLRKILGFPYNKDLNFKVPLISETPM